MESNYWIPTGSMNAAANTMMLRTVIVFGVESTIPFEQMGNIRSCQLYFQTNRQSSQLLQSAGMEIVFSMLSMNCFTLKFLDKFFPSLSK